MEYEEIISTEPATREDASEFGNKNRKADYELVAAEAGTFDPANTAEAFNRFTLGYTSTQPLYGKITYAVGSKTVTDDFYLEAGEHLVASRA